MLDKKDIENLSKDQSVHIIKALIGFNWSDDILDDIETIMEGVKYKEIK